MKNSALATHALLSSELRFLILCCKSKPDENDISLIRTIYPKIDTERFMMLLHQHAVLPLVYKTLKELTQEKHLEDTQLLAILKQHYFSNTQRNMLMSAELLKITELLEQNSIEALSFKGPTLALEAYGDISLRQFGDIDLLIKSEERHRLLEPFITEHYAPEIDLDTHKRALFFEMVNVLGFTNRTNGIRIEIHWEPLSKNYAIDWPEEDLWDNYKAVLLNHNSVGVLKNEQLLLYLCIHGAKHLFERVAWVCDIDRMVRTHTDIDWENLLNEARKLGALRMLYTGLGLAQHFFDLTLPAKIQKAIEEDRVLPKIMMQILASNYTAEAHEGKSYSSFLLLWQMRERLRDRLRFAWRAFFSPKFDDFNKMELPKYLSFLYPLLRPFRLIIKYAKR